MCRKIRHTAALLGRFFVTCLRKANNSFIIACNLTQGKHHEHQLQYPHGRKPKRARFSYYRKLWLNPAQAVKLFLNQIADTQALPLSLAYKAGKIPNAVTTRALEEAIAERNNPTAQTYTLAEAMQAMQELASE